MGKSSVSSPDYSGIAAANAQSAQLQYQLGQEQYQFGKDQFNSVWPYAQQYLQAETGAVSAQQQSARQQQSFYNTTYKPIEAEFANQVGQYNSQANSDRQAGAAMADVANTYESSRNSALSSLESYGIDPSQTRYGALDLSSRISQAAATAAAGTQSRLNTQATGLALEGQAINVGRGYQNDIAQAYNTATNAGASGINSANSTYGSSANTSALSQGYFSGSTSANNAATNALNTGFGNRLDAAKLSNSNSASIMSGIGSMASLATAMFM